MHELQCQPGPAGFVGTICVAVTYTILRKEMRTNCFHVRNLKGKHCFILLKSLQWLEQSHRGVHCDYN